MTKAFAKIRFAEYSESSVAETLRACGGDIGGGSETLILDTLVFDGGQIASPSVGLHPKWGGVCTSLSVSHAGQMMVVIKETDDAKPLERGTDCPDADIEKRRGGDNGCRIKKTSTL